MEKVTDIRSRKIVEAHTKWKDDANYRIEPGNEGVLEEQENDNIMDQYDALQKMNGLELTDDQIIMGWFTQKSPFYKDGAAPIDFVLEGQGWKILNQLHEGIKQHYWNDGFDQGLVRGRQEILDMLNKEGIAHNINAKDLPKP